MRKFVKTVVGLLIIAFLLLGIITFSVGAYFDGKIDYELDERLFSMAKGSTTASFYAYDKLGKLVEVWRGTRNSMKSWVNLSDVSSNLVSAFISAEDREFYSHNGVNIRRTISAFFNYLVKSGRSYGASTITQQVIKNISGDNDYSLTRKFNEIMRALHLEMSHSKEEILELYLNIVPMSGNIVGVEEASRIYFEKEPSELTIAEAATIAGITNAPTKYNPHTNPSATKEKRDNVLYAMYKNGEITYEEYVNATMEKLNISKTNQSANVTPWYIENAIDEIRADIMNKYGISKNAATILLFSGTSTLLTMNIEVQRIMEDYFGESCNLPIECNDGLRMAMCIIDHRTGNILGIIGSDGKKTGDHLYNYATALHPPASTIKPISIYAPLIEDDLITPSTVVDDNPVDYEIYNDGEYLYPKNSPDIYDGPITVADAIKKSKNTASVRLFRSMGENKVFSMLKERYDFKGLNEKVIVDGKTYTDKSEAALALGQFTYGISLVDLTSAYSGFANEGVLNTPKSYFGIMDSNGTPIIEKEKKEKKIYSVSTARLMNQLLASVVDDGTARSITLKDLVDTAGKTGTSSSNKDRLFVGYTPYITAGIWCGYENGASINKMSKTHLQIWDEVMKRIHERVLLPQNDDSVLSFNTTGLEKQIVCKKTGMLAEYHCIERDNYEIVYFKEGSAPKEYCDNIEKSLQTE